MPSNNETRKKAEQTKKEKYGENYHSRIGSIGGRKRKRGYFGTLKDEGRLDELKKISKEAIKKREGIRNRKKPTRKITDAIRREG